MKKALALSIILSLLLVFIVILNRGMNLTDYGNTSLSENESMTTAEAESTTIAEAETPVISETESVSGDAAADKLGTGTVSPDIGADTVTGSSGSENDDPGSGENGEDYYDISLTFAGDINFDENWATTQYMDSCENGITDCISPELTDIMNKADIMWINNEFTYSRRGTPTEGKAYTFRADPDRVSNLKVLGVDIAGLANNHVYDYGKDALLDTLDTLDNAGIPYVGAGRNLAEAMEPYYFEIDGVKIAYVAASRAEKIRLTPQATDTEPGILRCYDTELFDAEIEEAKENADYVIACVHWGTEYSTELEEVQLETAKEYIDAGADAVIGAHTHCLQGIEFIEGKPVIFSLGNFWFNDKTLDSMLVTLEVYNDESGKGMNVTITPALQENTTVTYVSDPAKQRELYDRIEDMSIDVSIDDKGNVSESL